MKRLVVLLFAILGVNQLFARGTLDLVNTQTLDMNLAETLTISYSSDDIVLLESDSNNLILKEFITRNNPEYFAKIENSQNAITISNGKRPWFHGVSTRIEIYIPKTFTGNLVLSLQSGNLEIKSISSEYVLLEVSSGNITIDKLMGSDLTVRNRTGNTNINTCQGKVNIINQSGNIVINDFVGEGLFAVRSGNIHLTVNDIVGDISLSTNSGNIDFVMGRNVSFILDAEGGSGDIRIPNLTGQIRTISQYNIGSNPIYRVFATCGSGNINMIFGDVL